MSEITLGCRIRRKGDKNATVAEVLAWLGPTQKFLIEWPHGLVEKLPAQEVHNGFEIVPPEPPLSGEQMAYVLEVLWQAAMSSGPTLNDFRYQLSAAIEGFRK